jgi:hypothetical protein
LPHRGRHLGLLHAFEQDSEFGGRRVQGAGFGTGKPGVSLDRNHNREGFVAPRNGHPTILGDSLQDAAEGVLGVTRGDRGGFDQFAARMRTRIGIGTGVFYFLRAILAHGQNSQFGHMRRFGDAAVA